MKNKYIDALSVLDKNVLVHSRKESITNANRKDIKLNYILKMIIIDIFVFMFMSTVTILIAYSNMKYTSVVLLTGSLIFLILLIVSFLITQHAIQDTCNNSYIIKAYIAKTVLWDNGSTKVYIIYYDKKREKYILVEDFLEHKLNYLRWDISNHFVNIIVKEKERRLVYVRLDGMDNEDRRSRLI